MSIETTMPSPPHPVVTYGVGSVEATLAFGVNWVDIGYFDEKRDKRNSVQVVFIDRSATGSSGDFDVEFNYNQIEWDEGDDSSSIEDGYGDGESARVFLTDNDTIRMEAFGSGEDFILLDTIIDHSTRTNTGVNNYSNGLIYRSHDTLVPGRFLIRFRNGAVLGDYVVTVDAGPDPTAGLNPQLTAFTVTGSSVTPPGSTTTYLWTVDPSSQGNVSITSPTQLTTAIRLETLKTATLILSAECRVGQFVFTAKDTVVLDRIAP